MPIKLQDIFRISPEELRSFKLHLAVSNGVKQPLRVFTRDREEWRRWNEWRSPKVDRFTRPYVLSLIDFFHEHDRWLFGGVFEIKERNEDRYVVEFSDRFRPYVGRLLVRFHNPGRMMAPNLETYCDDLEVARILRTEYTGEAFPGFEDICITFDDLTEIIEGRREGWRAALENVKGVYVIFDTSNGQKYVGSASGDEGIWSRWSAYAATGHGGNADLRAVVEGEGIEYASRNFQFSLLEHWSMNTSDEKILARESFWKRVLLSRDFGYNEN